MHTWMLMAMMGGVMLLGVLFGMLIVRLDETTLEDIEAHEQDRWVSIV